MEPGPGDPLASLFALEKLGIKFGLENIAALCDALGRPQDAWPSVIIAGTNGKGSVAAMVERGLREAGYATGLYTSPHLVHLEERFAFGGEPVTTARLRRAAAAVLDAAASARARGRLSTDPTFFEATTAIAFELFREAGVDLAVLEVGLGGRFDATNVAAPRAAAITTIDFDHQELLGHTLRDIAAEKAGVIKPGMPVVVGERKAEPLEVIASACAERGARLILAHDGVTASPGAGGALALRTPRRDYGSVRLSLAGSHQRENAIVAVRLLEELGDLGFAIPPDAVRVALADTRWPGRLDLREVHPGRDVLLDAAHNPAGATVLAAYLREFAPGGLPLVFAMMRDKEIAGTLRPLLPFASPLILTRPSIPRAMPPDAVRQLLPAAGPAPSIEVEPDVGRALELAWGAGNPICACGSIFLVGEVLERLGLPAWRRP